MMLAAMRTRSFVVAVAYTKTEAAQIALFGLVALNDPPTAALIAAIALATIGVALMAAQSRKELAGDWRSAALGLVLRDLLRLRGDRLPLGGDRRREPVAGARRFAHPGRRPRDPERRAQGLSRRVRPRRRAGDSRGLALVAVAGFMGALASQLWFIAFALTDAARVRTLALIEVPFAQAVSLKMFREPPSLREGIGMSLIVVAAAILVWTAG